MEQVFNKKEAKADNKQSVKRLKKAEREKRLEPLRQEAQKHLCKDTWFEEIHPVLTNAFAIITALFGLIMIFLPYSGKNTLITNIYPLLLSAVLIPPVFIVLSMIFIKVYRVLLSVGIFAFVFEASACIAAMVYGKAFSIFSLMIL